MCVEDTAAYNLGVLGKPEFSAIRAFLHMRGYCLVSQALVSFVYINRQAIGQAEPARGFRINASWVEWLARQESIGRRRPIHLALPQDSVHAPK